MANILNIGFSAVATGTADVITATYSPAITLTDRRIVFLRITTPNTTTTPTFNPNSLGAKTITKLGGDALNAGDLQGDCILMYDLTNTRWELITAKASVVSPDGLKTVVATDSFARVLATNSSTIEAYLFADLLKAQLYYYDDDNAGGNVYIDKDRLTLTHDVLVNVVATNFRLSSETASKVAIIDANKNVKSADTATYPSLTELSYVKGVTSAIQTQLGNKQNVVTGVDDTEIGYLNGVTSAIQTQLDSKVLAISFFHTSNQSIADSTSYFLAHVTAPATALANSSMVPVKAGTLVGVSLGGFNASTVGSNEAWTVKLWYNDGLNSVTLTTAFTGGNANRNYFLDVDGLSTAISDGNCAVEFKAPALATNPTGFRGTATIYIRP